MTKQNDGEGVLMVVRVFEALSLLVQIGIYIAVFS